MSKHPPRLPHPPTGPHAVEELGHAQNPAWWTVMIIGILSGGIGALAVLLLSPVLGIVSAILAVVTIVAGVVMSKMGMGSYTYTKGGDTSTDSEAVGIH